MIFLKKSACYLLGWNFDVLETCSPDQQRSALFWATPILAFYCLLWGMILFKILHGYGAEKALESSLVVALFALVSTLMIIVIHRLEIYLFAPSGHGLAANWTGIFRSFFKSIVRIAVSLCLSFVIFQQIFPLFYEVRYKKFILEDRKEFIEMQLQEYTADLNKKQTSNKSTTEKLNAKEEKIAAIDNEIDKIETAIRNLKSENVSFSKKAQNELSGLEGAAKGPGDRYRGYIAKITTNDIAINNKEAEIHSLQKKKEGIGEGLKKLAETQTNALGEVKSMKGKIDQRKAELEEEILKTDDYDIVAFMLHLYEKEPMQLYMHVPMAIVMLFLELTAMQLIHRSSGEEYCIALRENHGLIETKTKVRFRKQKALAMKGTTRDYQVKPGKHLGDDK